MLIKSLCLIAFIPLTAGAQLVSNTFAFVSGCPDAKFGNPHPAAHPKYHPDEPETKGAMDGFYLSQFLVSADQFTRFLNTIKKTGVATEHFHLPLNTPSTVTTFAISSGQYQPLPLMSKSPAWCTWDGAREFCRWYSALATNASFRLPSEAEWEFAARGCENRAWPWGGAAPTKDHGLRYAKPLVFSSFPSRGSYPDNRTPDGVYDMLAYLGAEWCASPFQRLPMLADLKVKSMAGSASLRAQRGIYRKKDNHRKRKPGPFDLLYGNWETPPGTSHLGRSWSRRGLPQSRGMSCFRIVMEDLNLPRPSTFSWGKFEAGGIQSNQQVLVMQGGGRLGIELRVENLPPNALQSFTLKTIHPMMKTPEGMVEASEKNQKAMADDKGVASISNQVTFDEGYKLVPGEWRVEIWIENLLLANKTFSVTIP